MAFVNLSGKKPEWVGQGAGAEVLATGQADFYDVVHESSEQYAKDLRAGRKVEATQEIVALHLATRLGGTAPESPWEIPRAS